VTWNELMDQLNSYREATETQHQDLVAEIHRLLTEKEGWDSDRDAYEQEVSTLNRDIGSLTVTMRKLQEERNQYRAHSELLNRLSFQVAQALRPDEPDATTFTVDPEREVAELIARYLASTQSEVKLSRRETKLTMTMMEVLNLHDIYPGDPEWPDIEWCLQELIRRYKEADEAVPLSSRGMAELEDKRKARKFCLEHHMEPSDLHEFARWALEVLARKPEEVMTDGS